MSGHRPSAGARGVAARHEPPRAVALAAALVAAIAAGRAPAQSPTRSSASAPARAFVEVDGAPAQAWVGQACELVVRVGVDAAWFAAQSVPLAAQSLDQPFHLTAPWLQSGDDAVVAIVPPPAGAPQQRVAVGDRAEALAVAAPRTIDGRAFTVLELLVRWQPRRAAEFELAPARVRYAFATAFVEDFLRGRQPRDRQEASVASAALCVRVAALPQPAPAGFTGAIGAFTLAVRPAMASATVGEALAVTVSLAGDGNFGAFGFALAQPLPGFHVDGVVAVPGSDGRAFRLDVLPLRAGARELPPLPFAVFDPRAGVYTTIAAPPAPLAITPARVGLSPRVQQLVDADAAAVAAARPARVWPATIAAALALLIAGLLHARRRRARRAAIDAAIAAFAAAPATDATARLAAFEAALAQLAGLPAWRADGFAVLASRAPSDAVAALRAHHGALAAARFGGVAPPTQSALADLRRSLR